MSAVRNRKEFEIEVKRYYNWRFDNIFAECINILYKSAWKRGAILQKKKKKEKEKRSENTNL